MADYPSNLFPYEGQLLRELFCSSRSSFIHINVDPFWKGHFFKKSRQTVKKVGFHSKPGGRKLAL